MTLFYFEKTVHRTNEYLDKIVGREAKKLTERQGRDRESDLEDSAFPMHFSQGPGESGRSRVFELIRTEGSA